MASPPTSNDGSKVTPQNKPFPSTHPSSFPHIAANSLPPAELLREAILEEAQSIASLPTDDSHTRNRHVTLEHARSTYELLHTVDPSLSHSPTHPDAPLPITWLHASGPDLIPARSSAFVSVHFDPDTPLPPHIHAVEVGNLIGSVDSLSPIVAIPARSPVSFSTDPSVPGKRAT